MAGTMATTSNTPAMRQAAMRKKMPRRKYPWGAPFHVPILATQTTSHDELRSQPGLRDWPNSASRRWPVCVGRGNRRFVVRTAENGCPHLECPVHAFTDSSQQIFCRNEIVQRLHHEYALMQYIRAAHDFFPPFRSTLFAAASISSIKATIVEGNSIRC